MAASVGANALPSASGTLLRHAGIGPWKSSAGAFYALTRHTGTNFVDIVKTPDPMGGTWAVAGSINLGLATAIAAGHQVGDVLHLACGDEAGRIRYYRFNMATDTLEINGEELQGTSNTSGPAAGYAFTSIAVLSDGRVVLAYAGWTTAVGMDKFNTVVYRVRGTDGVWAAAVTLDNGGSVHWSNPVAVLGASDRVHFLWAEPGGLRLHSRTLSATNVLSAISTVDASAGVDATRLHIMQNGSSYVDGGITKVFVPYGDIAPNNVVTVGSVTFDSVDAPAFSLSMVQDDASLRVANNASVISSVVDGATRHALWSHGGTADLMRDVNAGAGWGTDVNELAGTINSISANVYDRAGSKLAMILNDAGVIKYAEITLAPPDTDPPLAPGSLTVTGVYI